MRNFKKLPVILFTLATLIMVGTVSEADDSVYGITIEQRALDVLTYMFENLNEALGANDLQQVISMKAKFIVSDVAQPGELTDQVGEMVFQTRLEIFKASPDMVLVNLSSSFGELKFLVRESGSIALFPDDEVFAKINFPQLLPSNLMLPLDDNGLFTLINLMGGIPFGLLLSHPSTVDDGVGLGSDTEFSDELDPSDIYARIRYRGTTETEAGTVYVVSVEAVKMLQYIKIWVLKDTMELYQISIEDRRGTEVFIVIDELDTNPLLSEEDFKLDVSGFKEIGEEEFMWTTLLKIMSLPPIESPMALDIYATHERVARTSTVTISTDGFDMQDNEQQLVCEVESKSPGGAWTPVEEREYAGFPPVGHWNAYFKPDGEAELGPYSFRSRYVDTSGNASEWLEASDLVEVTPAPPRVVATKPTNNQTGISISTDISVTFSKPMDRKSVEDAFSVVSGSGRSIKGTFTWNENTLVFSPEGELEYNKGHLVRIKGSAMSAEGVGLDGNYDMISDGIPYDDYIWQFKTLPIPPMLKLVRKDQPVYMKDWFEVKITANNVVGMYRFGFKLVFDPEMLMVRKVDKASFASWRPRPQFIEDVDLWSEVKVDNSSGLVTIACNSTRKDGVSGEGDIATIGFQAIGAGAASLNFRDVIVTDASGKIINAEPRGLEIQIMEFHPKDVNHDGVVDIRDMVALASSEDRADQAAARVDHPALGQNFPNPFNPETWIPYQLERPSQVTVRIYSLTGEVVRTLDLGYNQAGFYMDKMKAAYWDGRDSSGQRVSSGVYFYTIQADGFSATKKMLMCK